jgi:serine/threonine protein kinase
VLYFAS